MLNIARNIYLAWNTTNQKFELPEVEVIPIGDSANEKRKGASATKKYVNLREFENRPLPGFALHKTDRKNWGSIDQTWLVIDPRGFLVRITNDNLEQILHVTGITEGLIQEKCIWARKDTQTKTMLIPVSSAKYAEAVSNTELLEGKVNIKDVQIGDEVLLQNQLKGTYMGVVSLYGPMNDYSTTCVYKPQVYLRRQVVKISPGKYHYQTDVKILKVLKKAATPLTREDSVEEMSKDIAGGAAYFTSSSNMNGRYYSIRGVISAVSTNAVPKVSMTFEEVDKVEAEALFNLGTVNSDIGRLLLVDKSDNKFLVDYPYSFNSTKTTSIHGFDVSRLTPCTLDKTEMIKLDYKRQAYFPGVQTLDNFAKFYKIVKHVKDKSYI